MTIRIPLTAIAQDSIKKVLKPGDCAVDATIGNGYDTRFLAEQVGPQGRVFGFDIQQLAIEKTTQQLKQHQLESRVSLYNHSHEDFASLIPKEYRERIHAFMFNLGYLPGGEKTKITCVESTLKALKSALQYLATNGKISVLAYTGHPGGRDETEAIKKWAYSLDREKFEMETHIPPSKTNTAPELVLIHRRS